MLSLKARFHRKIYWYFVRERVWVRELSQFNLPLMWHSGRVNTFTFSTLALTFTLIHWYQLTEDDIESPRTDNCQTSIPISVLQIFHCLNPWILTDGTKWAGEDLPQPAQTPMPVKNRWLKILITFVYS